MLPLKVFSFAILFFKIQEIRNFHRNDCLNRTTNISLYSQHKSKVNFKFSKPEMKTFFTTKEPFIFLNIMGSKKSFYLMKNAFKYLKLIYIPDKKNV